MLVGSCASLFGTIKQSNSVRDPHHQIVRAFRNAAQMASPKNGFGPVSTALVPSEQPLRNRNRMPLGGEPKLCVADVSISESQAQWIYRGWKT